MTAKLWLVVAVLAGLLVGGIGLAVHERNVGRDQQRAADLPKAAHVAAHAVAKAETVYVAKTDTFTIWRTKLATVRDTVLKHLTDTVLVRQYVATADSTIRACSDVILSCDTVRARYRALVAKDSTLAASPKPNASFLSHIRKFVGPTITLSADDKKLHAGISGGIGWTW